MIAPEVVMAGFFLAALALTAMMVLAQRAEQFKVAVVAEGGAFAFNTAAVWIVYHYAVWTPEHLQLWVAVAYALAAAVWGSGLIDRARDAFTDPDAGLPPAVVTEDTDDWPDD